MNIYFARLDGDIVGIDAYCRFEAHDIEEAKEIADQYALDNYAEYEDIEDDETPYYATVELWDDEKHGPYLGQGCFSDYVEK